VAGVNIATKVWVCLGLGAWPGGGWRLFSMGGGGNISFPEREGGKAKGGGENQTKPRQRTRGLECLAVGGQGSGVLGVARGVGCGLAWRAEAVEDVRRRFPGVRTVAGSVVRGGGGRGGQRRGARRLGGMDADGAFGGGGDYRDYGSAVFLPSQAGSAGLDREE